MRCLWYQNKHSSEKQVFQGSNRNKRACSSHGASIGRENIRWKNKYKKKNEAANLQTDKEKKSRRMVVYATSTGAGSNGIAAIDSAAPVLLGAGAISGSGICMSS